MRTFLVNKKVSKENFTERFRAIPSCFTRKMFGFNLYTFKTEQSLLAFAILLEVT